MSRGNSKGIDLEWVAPNVGSQGRSRGGWRRSSAPARACRATHRCRSTIPGSKRTAVSFGRTRSCSTRSPMSSSMPGPVLQPCAKIWTSNLKEPRIFGNDILQGRLGAAGITLGTLRLQFDLRSRRPCRRRHAGRASAADRRFWPDHVRLGRYRRALCRAPLLRSLDPARFGRRGGGHRARSARLGDGRGSFSAGRGPSARARCRPRLISANGRKLRTPRSTSTASCGRIIIRPAGGSCVRRLVCPPSSSRRLLQLRGSRRSLRR